MKIITKILLIALLLAPTSAFATIATPWNATSTDKGYITPTTINGNNPDLFLQGNVGVGTSKPTQVNANARLTVAGISSQDIISSTTDNTTLSDAIMRVYAPGSSMFMGSHGTNQITTQYGITVGGWAEIGAVNSSFGTSNGLLIGTRTTATPIVFGTNSLERMRILSTGAVGIGLTNPGSILEVQGTSTASTGQAFIAWDSNAKNIFQIANNGSTTLGNFGLCNGSNAIQTTSAGTFVCGAISPSFGNAFNYVQATSNNYLTPTTTTVGLLITASSTIGNGTAAGGLTISGGATTTGTSTFQANVLINTAAANSRLTVNSGSVSFGDALTSIFTTNGQSNISNRQVSLVNMLPLQVIDNDTGTGNGPVLGFTVSSPGTNNYTSAIGSFRTGSAGQGGMFFATKNSTSNGVAPVTALTIDQNQLVGVGTTSPFAKFSVHANAGDTNTVVFAVASSTAVATTTLFSVGNTGSTTIAGPIFETSTGSSTFAQGINLTAGCYAIAGACLSTGGSLTGTTGQTAYFSGTNTAVGTSSLTINTAQTVNIGGTRGMYPFLTIGTSTSGIPGGNVDALYMQGNAPSDMQFEMNNITPGFASNFVLDANSNFAAYTINGTGSQWKFGEFGLSDFSVFDGQNSKTPFDIQMNTPTGTLNLQSSGDVGVGTSTPFAVLSVSGTGSATVPVFAVATSSNQGQPNFEIDASGHMVTSGPKPVCTTNCTFKAGNDNAFRILSGAGVTSETVTFAKPWSVAPICHAEEGDAANAAAAASSTATQVVITTASISSKDVEVICIGIQ